MRREETWCFCREMVSRGLIVEGGGFLFEWVSSDDGVEALIQPDTNCSRSNSPMDGHERISQRARWTTSSRAMERSERYF